MEYDKERLDFYLYWRWNYTWRNTKYHDIVRQLRNKTAQISDYYFGDFVAFCNSWRGNYNDFPSSTNILKDFVSNNLEHKYPPIALRPESIEIAMSDHSGQCVNFNNDISVTFNNHSNSIAMMKVDVSLDDECLITEFKKSLILAKYSHGKSLGRWPWIEGEVTDKQDEWVLHRYKNYTTYFRGGDLPRIIGLWLWENLKENFGKFDTLIDAIDEFESLSFFNELKLGRDPSYGRWLARTKECIDVEEVLPIVPKNKQHTSGTKKRKLVPGTKTVK